MKDLTRKQFEAALLRHGFAQEGFLGYWRHESGVSVSKANGATVGARGAVHLPRRRERLARMIQTVASRTR